ncbi:MAG TPA: gephyrin-like molybdotransferase Glp [Stellaceae bacterium]|nr:gephyrin-like molybdotransferase Glp [Stellaceae bacterium]
MAQLADDCFAFGGALMSADAALALLTERVVTLPDAETISLRGAVGRVLAEDVVAGFSVPPHDNSAVDGYAVRHADLDPLAPTRLPVVGRAAAGHPLDGPVAPGTALRIFTGAPMPVGTDTVMMQEDCRLEGDHVSISPGIKPGANRRRAGEDIAAGATVLARGIRLRAQEIGVAASLGRTGLSVYRPLRVAVLSTGDELREPGTVLPAGAIYDSNRHALMALLDGLGLATTDLGIQPDQPAALRRVLADAAASHDVVMSSGGMSTGEEDHVKAALVALGSLHFWRLAIKPGRPVALGQIGRVPFLGLPGNPVAAMVTFLTLARPLLLRLQGASHIHPNLFRVRADFDYRKKPGRREYVRATIARDASGQPVAARHPKDGAGILTSMAESQGLVVLDEQLTSLERGGLVDYLPFTEVMP